MAAFSAAARTSVQLKLFRNVRLLSNATAGSTLRDDKIKSYDQIPGPKSVPVFGSVLSFLWEKEAGMSLGKYFLERQFMDVAKYGEIFKRTLPGVEIVSVANPDAASVILRNEPKYPKRFDSPLLDYYRETRKTIPGVFFANGPDWYKYRSVISKRILRPREVADYSSVFSDISSDFLARVDAIRGPMGSQHENEVQALDNELFRWSFESVAYMLFDRRFGCLAEQVNPDAQEFIKSVGGFLDNVVPAFLVPVWFYKFYETKVFKEFVYHFDNMYRYADLFIGEKIQELEAEGKLSGQVEDGKRVDFFRFLLSSGTLSKEDLIASVIDLLFAGVDTTSNTMQWVLYTMGKHPDKQDKLYREVLSVLGPNDAPSSSTITKMPYLRAWLKETLRLYPVLSALPRQVPHDIDVLGYQIPAGTNFNILFYYMGRNEALFKDAGSFMPERWLRDDKHHMSEDLHAFASVPFGFGTRMCVGRRIAELELHLLMAKTVQRYLITYPHQDEIEPFMRGVTIPDRPVRVRFIDRPDK